MLFRCLSSCQKPNRTFVILIIFRLSQLSKNKIAIYPMTKGYIAIFFCAGEYRNFLLSLDCLMMDLICLSVWKSTISCNRRQMDQQVFSHLLQN